jgi:hypothetical protein
MHVHGFDCMIVNMLVIFFKVTFNNFKKKITNMLHKHAIKSMNRR